MVLLYKEVFIILEQELSSQSLIYIFEWEQLQLENNVLYVVITYYTSHYAISVNNILKDKILSSS